MPTDGFNPNRPWPRPSHRPAVFLDRDGTLLDLVHHLTDPADVRLLPGAADAVRVLSAAGYLIIVVTNQSVLGRQLLDEPSLSAIHDELHRQLAEHGTRIDGLYFCSEVPLSSDRRRIEHPDRKPGPGMLLRAAEEHAIDLAASVIVGDTVSDALAGRNAGCALTILVETGYGNDEDAGDPAFDHVVPDLTAAAALVLEVLAPPGPLGENAPP